MKTIAITLGAILILFGCKKKDAAITPPDYGPAYTAKDYCKAKPGNYWIYEILNIDTDNTVVSSVIDSAYVSDSTVINGRKHYRISSGSIAIDGYYADSANCILRNGGISFKLSFNNDTISKYYYSQSGGWYNLYSIMKMGPASLDVNNVTYTNCVSRYDRFYSNFNPACPNRVANTVYCAGIGVVYASYFYTNYCGHYETKLLRYKVN